MADEGRGGEGEGVLYDTRVQCSEVRRRRGLIPFFFFFFWVVSHRF